MNVHRPPQATTIDIAVDGMTCASCVGRVEKAIASAAGVTRAEVNLATGRATVTFAGLPDIGAARAAIERAGYETHLPAAPDAAHRAEHDHGDPTLGRDTALAAALAAPVFAAEMAAHLVPAIHHWLTASLGVWNLYGQFVLTTIILAGPGRRFFVKGVPALLQAAPEMNALVALGTGAAWTYSVVATFLPAALPAGTANVYYEAAAVVVVLILSGRLLEGRARGRTSDAIRHLVGLQPQTALVRRDGTAVDIDIADMRVGDVAIIRPGERITGDGTVVEGKSFVDESMISGEPVPVAKSAGDTVTGGTINQAGALDVRITHVGADTVLARIVAMVETAQGTKLPIQRTVDRITGWFVPAVMAAALVTFAAWIIFGPAPSLGFALVNAVAVLIIACPCAMGLATPTSIMVGTGRAAELGVLFRKGDALQRLRDAGIVAFDKTGTLTDGRPTLTDFVVADGFDEADVLALVAAIEGRSEHPIAAALVAAARARGLVIHESSDFTATPGSGVAGTVAGRAVSVGTPRLMEHLGIDVTRFADTAARLGDDGKTPLYAAIDGRLAAILAVADPVKPSAAPVIATLHALGLEVAMISGDNRRTAEAVGRRLGIDHVVAEVLPEGKIATIRSLARDGRTIVFVGDGINDAPALAGADVGIAVGTGTDIAIESADVVLMSGDLRGVATALALSHATMRNIRQNLFWAFAYNVVLIPVAAGALYPAFGVLLSPMLAAGAMALSSVFVVGNALRLRRFEGVRA